MIRWSLDGLLVGFVFEAVALAFDVDDDAVVQETVENGGDNHGIVEELSPVGERLVRGDQRAGLFIALGHEAKEEIAFFPINGRVADFIDNHQGGLVIASSPAFALRLAVVLEFFHQVFHAGEVDGDPGLAGLDRERHREMGLAHARRAQQEDIGALLDESEIEERHHPLAIELGLKGEVELIDGFDERQAGDLQCGLHPALFFVRDFFFQQRIQKAEMAVGMLFRLGDCRRQNRFDVRQAQAREIGFDAIQQQAITHGRPPPKRGKLPRVAAGPRVHTWAPADLWCVGRGPCPGPGADICGD